jgi:glycerol-3-phosphate dehydrogenase
MNREEMIARMEAEPNDWDIIIIGGGATGLGTAIDAASRGYRTLLLEKSDFAKGTSSRSTKLVHGGVRYLQQGNISLVLEALRERERLYRNAPHLVHDQSFVIPHYRWWEGVYYGIGLKLYDLLARRQSFGRSRHLTQKQTVEHIPTIEREGLRSGTLYHDGQFDDARLAVNMAQTAVDHGAVIANYMPVVNFLKENGSVQGVIARDLEEERSYQLSGRTIVNATGVFSDEIRRLDDPEVRPIVQPSQGAHIVLDRSFLPEDSALLVPKTEDDRVVFAIPWHEAIVVGTTDTPVEQPTDEPRPLDEEISFILRHASQYLAKDLRREDILSAFAGLRPLVSLENVDEDTAVIPRDHTLQVSSAGLITISGGKWTTYRKMAEDTVDRAIEIGDLEDRSCKTHDLKLHGYHPAARQFEELSTYGSDAPALQELLDSQSRYAKKLHPERGTRAGEVVWAARHEMARTVEDFLSRRTRTLILDAATSAEMAPKVAGLLAEELGRDEDWERQQVEAYTDLTTRYLPADRSS